MPAITLIGASQPCTQVGTKWAGGWSSWELQVNMISNGLTCRPKISSSEAGRLVRQWPQRRWFREGADEFRAPGSFERVVRAILSAWRLACEPAVNTTINRLNQGLLKQMRQFLLDHGVFGWQLQFATASGTWKHTAIWFRHRRICCGWCPR